MFTVETIAKDLDKIFLLCVTETSISTHMNYMQGRLQCHPGLFLNCPDYYGYHHVQHFTIIKLQFFHNDSLIFQADLHRAGQMTF